MADLKIPEDLKYAESDEWVRLEGNIATVGITDFAQDALNDVVYVELPEVGASLNKETSFGTVESVKAASDLYPHVAGIVSEVNLQLESEPEIINADPYGEGWIIKIKLNSEPDLSDLMDATKYAAYCEDR